MWVDFKKILSYNTLFNQIYGERGVGKTYGAIEFCINHAIKTNGQEGFIYLRRYKTETQKSKTNLLNNFLKNNPNLQIEIKQNNIIFNKNIILGSFETLSTQIIQKGFRRSNIKYIIFDEFTILEGIYHYLPNEVEDYFLNFYESVAGLNDVFVFFLSNAISLSNPYLKYFNLQIPYKTEFKTYPEKDTTIWYIKNIEYREKKKNSRFGKIIHGTNYEKYAIDNEFLDNKNFIQKKTGRCKFVFNLEITKIYGIWINEQNNIFISLDYDKNKQIFTINENYHNNNKILISKNSIQIKTLINAYCCGKLFFENLEIKKDFTNL